MTPYHNTLQSAHQWQTIENTRIGRNSIFRHFSIPKTSLFYSTRAWDRQRCVLLQHSVSFIGSVILASVFHNCLEHLCREFPINARASEFLLPRNQINSKGYPFFRLITIIRKTLILRIKLALNSYAKFGSFVC